MAISPSRMLEGDAMLRQNLRCARVRASVILLTVSSSAAAKKRLTFESAAGTIRDALGRPVTNALVILRAADGRTVSRTTSGEHGQFELPSATGPGTYDLIVQKPGFKAASRDSRSHPPGVRTPFHLVMESVQALTVPVTASRVRAQNGLTATGASKYTFTAHDITNLPQAELRRSTRCCCRCRASRSTRTRRFTSAASMLVSSIR